MTTCILAPVLQLFLSEGVLQRPYCQMEIRHAVLLKKPIVLVHGECVTGNQRMAGIV